MVKRKIVKKGDRYGKKFVWWCLNSGTIIANKGDMDANNRTFKLDFYLKPGKYRSTDVYYMVIVDENGMVINKEEFELSIASSEREENSYYSN